MSLEDGVDAARAPVRRNVELKARLASLAAAEQTALRLAGPAAERQRQIDTYFVCPHGRLKLREIEGQGAQLVGYERPNESGPRTSDYRLIDVGEPAVLKAALADTLGIRCVVRKDRTIHLFRNVRIHLDSVEGLGAFLEFEAVLAPQDAESDGRRLVDELAGEFGVVANDLVGCSYAELLLAADARGGGNVRAPNEGETPA